MATCENFLVKPQGGLYKRPGTHHVAEVADSSKTHRIIPFVFNDEAAYILELGDYTMRVYRSEAQLQASSFDFTSSDVDTSQENVTIDTRHGYRDQMGPFRLTTTGTLPSGWSLATDYYIVLPATHTFDPRVTGSGGDIDPSSEDININSHGYQTNDGPFRFKIANGTTGTLPDDIDSEQDYYIIRTDANNFQIETEIGGGAVAFPNPTGGAGTATIYPTSENTSKYFKLSLTAGGAVDTISSGGSGTHTIAPGSAGVVYEIDTPWSESEVDELQYAQTADIMLITHRDHAPRKLSRYGHAVWVLDVMELFDGPYLANGEVEPGVGVFVKDALTITGSTNKGDRPTVTCTVDAFEAADIGRAMRFPDASNNAVGWGRIDGYTDSKNVRVRIMADLEDSSTEDGNVQMSAFSARTNMGYPRTVSFVDQRLALAGTAGKPQTFYASRSSDLFNFGPTLVANEGERAVSGDVSLRDGDSTEILDTHALDYTISSDRVSTILWMKQSRVLMIGTNGGTWPVGSGVNEPLTPTNVQIRENNAVGASSVPPVVVEDIMVHVGRDGRKVVGLGFSFQQDSFIPQNLTVLAPHIGIPSISQIDYQQNPDSQVWCVRSDGQIAVLTFVNQQEVFGWSRQVIGGSFSTGDAVAESVAVIPAPSGDRDQVWLIVKRTVNGNTVRYVEYVEDFHEDDDDLEDAWFLDSALDQTSGFSTSVTGLDHLEGEEVYGLSDGAVVGPFTVSSGGITLDTAPTSHLVVGLPYTATIKTLKVIAPLPEGTGQGKTKRIVSAIPRLYRSGAGEYRVAYEGPDSSTLTKGWFDLVRRQASVDMDTAPPLVTEDRFVELDSAWNRDPRIEIRSTAPLPLEILALMYDVAEGER